MAYLEYFDVNNKQQILNLTEQSVSIGRDINCDISFHEQRISRKHAEIFFENGFYHVRDLKSTNGVILNKHQISESELSQNDLLEIGSLKINFFDTDPFETSEPSVILNTKELTEVVSHASLKTFKQENKDKQLLSMFLEIAKVLDSIGSAEQLISHFMSAVLDSFNPDTCIIAYGDEYNKFPDDKAGVKDPFEGIILKTISHAKRKRSGIVFDNSKEDMENNKNLNTPVSRVCIPVLVSGMVRGVIYMDKRGEGQTPFTKNDADTLVVFGRLMSAAAISSEKFARLNAQNKIMKQSQGVIGNIIGESRSTKELISFIENKLSYVDTTVLLTGETGTGKTFIATAVHVSSKRVNGPFIKVNCAAIPDNLIESELFGHEKGSFSGAAAKKVGLFEAADKGTLFLDEIGELNHSSQAKLLTILQDRKLQRVGSTTTKDIDIRVIAATNIDLQEAVKNGSFRSDLYYRLNIIKLHILPLRERKDDIEPLAMSFLDRFCKSTGKNITGIENNALNLLKNYNWPGNIRELSNVIERAVIFGENGENISEDLLPDEFTEFSLLNVNLTDDNKSEERYQILNALKVSNGNKREAARMLGWYPQKFYARLSKYNL